MSDTIYFKGKLKKTKEPQDFFAKIQKGIKTKGVTKLWTAIVDDVSITIDFGDEASENFVFEFDGLSVESFCKVAFTPDEPVQDIKKSEFYTLLNIIYSTKSFFKEFELSDDFALCESFIDSKNYKLSLRELNAEETSRVKACFDKNCTNHTQMLIEFMKEDLGLPNDKEFPKLTICAEHFSPQTLNIPYEYWLYQTSSYADMGRLDEIDPSVYVDLGSVGFSIVAFEDGMEALCGSFSGKANFGQKDIQVMKFFKDKFLPIFNAEENLYERLLLAYRFFLSVYDYCGFKFVGIK